MDKKLIYFISKNGNFDIYPDTHLFVFDNPVRAAYALSTFGGKLNDTDIKLVCCGYFDEVGIHNLPFNDVVSFDDIREFYNTLDDNDFVRCGLSKITALHHHNIVISSINNFRASLISQGAQNE